MRVCVRKYTWKIPPRPRMFLYKKIRLYTTKNAIILFLIFFSLYIVCACVRTPPSKVQRSIRFFFSRESEGGLTSFAWFPWSQQKNDKIHCLIEVVFLLFFGGTRRKVYIQAKPYRLMIKTQFLSIRTNFFFFLKVKCERIMLTLCTLNLVH